MRLSSMADYAVVAMVAAARQCGVAGADPVGDGEVRARSNAGQLALETGLPAPTVQKLVSRLVAAGLLTSARGAGGGLGLARDASQISLADIVEAVEGPIALTPCVEGIGHDCAPGLGCSVRPHWPVVNEALRLALSGVPLTRLMTPQDSVEMVQ